MGFWKDVIFGKQCEDCGRRTLEEYNVIGDVHMLWCRSCHVVSVDPSYHVPRCHRCGTLQTGTGENHAGVILPKCPNCGHIWDADD